jgi:hypothetical protein
MTKIAGSTSKCHGSATLVTIEQHVWTVLLLKIRLDADIGTVPY